MLGGDGVVASGASDDSFAPILQSEQAESSLSEVLDWWVLGNYAARAAKWDRRGQENRSAAAWTTWEQLLAVSKEAPQSGASESNTL